MLSQIPLPVVLSSDIPPFCAYLDRCGCWSGHCVCHFRALLPSLDISRCSPDQLSPLRETNDGSQTKMEASADVDRFIQRERSYAVVLESSSDRICWRRHDWVHLRRIRIQDRKLISCSYLTFPSAFNNNPDLTVRPSSITAVASILLALGYSTSMFLWFICHSSLFRLDTIFVYFVPRTLDP